MTPSAPRDREFFEMATIHPEGDFEACIEDAWPRIGHQGAVFITLRLRVKNSMPALFMNLYGPARRIWEPKFRNWLEQHGLPVWNWKENDAWVIASFLKQAGYCKLPVHVEHRTWKDMTVAQTRSL